MDKRLHKLILAGTVCLSLNTITAFAEININEEQMDYNVTQFVQVKTSVSKITTTNLNLRSGPSTNNSIILTIPKNSEVTVLETIGTWNKVNYNNKIGYVNSTYLKASTPSTTTTKYETTTDSLNVRSSATTSSSILGKLAKGTKVDVISIANGWAKIKYNNQYAYVSTTYLKLVSTSTSTGSTTTTPSTPSTTTTKYETTTDSLNVRSSATTSSSILGKLAKGTKVDVISIANGWAKIKYNNQDAYVSTTYLKIVENTLCTVTQDVYLRKEKNWSSEKLKLIEKGELLEYINKEDVWIKVKSNNEEGYISKDYISSSENIENEQVKPSEKVVKYTTTTDVNFRKGPSTSYSIIASLEKGTAVTVIETQDNWDKIEYNGQVGYMNNKYLTTTKPAISEGTGLLPSPEFSKTKIVLDAGHGGTDSGAVGKYKKLKEKDLVLEITLKVNKELTRLGFNTILTRSSDVYPSLSSRYKLANNNNADLFLSIHFNSATNENAKGIETLYKNNSEFSKSLQNALIKETNAVNRGLKYRSDLAVLNGSKMTASLVELGFLSNKEEEERISTDDYKNKLSNAIVKGIVDYVK